MPGSAGPRFAGPTYDSNRRFSLRYTLPTGEQRAKGPQKPREPLYTLQELEPRLNVPWGVMRSHLGGWCRTEGAPAPILKSKVRQNKYKLSEMRAYLKSKGVIE